MNSKGRGSSGHGLIKGSALALVWLDLGTLQRTLF